MTRALILVTAALMAAPLPAFAGGGMQEMQKNMQDMHQKMQQMHEKMMQGPPGDTSAMNEADKAFAESMSKMHASMDVKSTGDADIDFANHMIPHHQGAIDMANVVLKFGKDPEIKKLAEDIVKAQEAEIALMKTWLDKHGKPAAPSP